jgi:hypothetical protein
LEQDPLQLVSPVGQFATQLPAAHKGVAAGQT